MLKATLCRSLPLVPPAKKVINFEGSRPNGPRVQNQRHFLHIVACVKIDFGAFWEKSASSMISLTFGDIR